MKYMPPPENLPVVPELDAQDGPEAAPREDVHFRDPAPGATVTSTRPGDAAPGASPAPAPRSLQPIRVSMPETKERPIRAPDDLLSVQDVAERLLVSKAAVYRYVAHGNLPYYRLPSGIRFKVADVDAYLDSRRAEAQPARRYGHPQDQR